MVGRSPDRNAGRAKNHARSSRWGSFSPSRSSRGPMSRERPSLPLVAAPWCQRPHASIRALRLSGNATTTRVRLRTRTPSFTFSYKGPIFWAFPPPSPLHRMRRPPDPILRNGLGCTLSIRLAPGPPASRVRRPQPCAGGRSRPPPTGSGAGRSPLSGGRRSHPPRPATSEAEEPGGPGQDQENGWRSSRSRCRLASGKSGGESPEINLSWE